MVVTVGGESPETIIITETISYAIQYDNLI